MIFYFDILFQIKMKKVYTFFQTKTGLKPYYLGPRMADKRENLSARIAA